MGEIADRPRPAQGLFNIEGASLAGIVTVATA
jgi:hypothetical protein